MMDYTYGRAIMTTDKISISKFSLMTRLTQKALRLYDKKGILVPKQKNGLTGYRYYTISQVETGLKIKSLSMLGFNLDQISDFLKCLDENNKEKIQQNINIRLGEVRREKQKLANIEEFLLKRNKEVFEMTIGEPTIKKIPEMRVLSIRKIGSFDQTIGELIERICTTITNAENENKVTVTGPIMTLCYDEDFKEKDNDIEAAIPISGQITVNDQDMEIKTIPSCKVLSYVHKGSYRNLHEKYTYLFKYAQEQGLIIKGPCRELYFNDPAEVSENDLKTEIQLPIED